MNEDSETDNEITSLDSLSFLLGKWQAVSKPGEPTGSFEFTLRLQSRIIIRTNYADYPATNGHPAFRHDDLMIIYQVAGEGLRADYYDSEGHVIRYTGQISGNNQVVFFSQPTASSPAFRLGYNIDPDGRLNGSFEVAQPNQPDTFTPYLAWSAIKTSESNA